MKIVTLRAPWAWAVRSAGKRIENRSWSTGYRGPVLIHAAKACPAHYAREAFDWMRDRALVASTPRADDLPRAAVAAAARIVDVLDPDAPRELHGVDMRWWNRVDFGFVLEDVQPIPLVPWSGSLGLRDAPAELVARCGLRPA